MNKIEEIIHEDKCKHGLYTISWCEECAKENPDYGIIIAPTLTLPTNED